MPEISAKQVQTLRAKTDLAMMDCKNALVEAGGDEAKALEILRKKFADKMSVRADKEAANGRIGIYADEKGAALCEVRCETDFVATNDTFRELANQIAQAALNSGLTEGEKIKAAKAADGRTVNDHLIDAFGKLKENMNVQRAKLVSGIGAAYVHHNGKVGAAIGCDGAPGEAGRHICMHIASTQLITGLTREDVPAAEIEAARAKFKEEVQGKPEQIIDKIVSGKMDRWFGERVLVEQPFVMDDKKTVGAYAKEHGFTIKSFTKMEVGAMN